MCSWKVDASQWAYICQTAFNYEIASSLCLWDWAIDFSTTEEVNDWETKTSSIISEKPILLF